MSTSKKQTENSSNDIVKWISFSVFTLAVLVLNFYAHMISKPMLSLIWVAWLAISLGILSFTELGKSLIILFQDAKTELLKVVWPTRQETMQMTIIIMVVVGLVSIMLWGIDSVLLWLVGKLTSLK